MNIVVKLALVNINTCSLTNFDICMDFSIVIMVRFLVHSTTIDERRSADSTACDNNSQTEIPKKREI